MTHEHKHDHDCTCGHEHHHHHEHDCTCGHEHHHHHEHDCNCGHEHHHHDHDCNCGHEHHHDHEHECGCGCGHHHHRDPRPITEQALSVEVNGNELAILKTVEAVGCLPVARFIATNGDEEVVIDCLSPVYLYDEHDTMEEVKAIGAVLQGLEDKGLMTLDYDMPIVDFDYTMYLESDLYAYFEKTMLEAQGREGFLCDTAGIELGSMAVTDLGAQVCAREE